LSLTPTSTPASGPTASFSPEAILRSSSSASRSAAASATWMKLRTLGSVRRRRERYSDVISAAVLSPESSDSRMERMEDVAGPGAKVVAGADWREETAVNRRRAGVGRRRWEIRRRWAWRGGGMAAAGVVGRAEVEEKVRQLMDADGEAGKNMRARAAWAQQTVKSAVSDSGASRVALRKLVDELQRTYGDIVSEGKV